MLAGIKVPEATGRRLLRLYRNTSNIPPGIINLVALNEAFRNDTRLVMLVPDTSDRDIPAARTAAR